MRAKNGQGLASGWLRIEGVKNGKDSLPSSRTN